MPTEPAQPVTDSLQASTATPVSTLLTQLERVAGIMLGNRLMWLILGMALYLLLQLALVQHSHKRFHDFVLEALQSSVIEFTLLSCAVLLALASPTTIRVYAKKFAARPSYLPLGLGATLCLMLVAVLELIFCTSLWTLSNVRDVAPLLPLTLMQRTTLLCLMAMSVFSAVMGLRHIARLPWGVGAAIALLAYGCCAYWITLLSSRFEAFQRLNDVFFYNALQSYLKVLPQLTRRLVYHNIETPYFGYYVLAAAALAALAMALWIPFATARISRET